MTQKPGILIVEEEPSIRMLCSAVLEEQGFSVFSASNGFKALEDYRRHHEEIDAALLDVGMEGIDGVKVLVALKRLDPHLRCCFMTGGAMYSDQELLALGAARVLKKPFSAIELTQAIRQLMEPEAEGPVRK